ncbi:aldehyde dehydrogenase family protein [Nocardia amamiensis]|uniref:Aldehyde dehydrogenase family protein n=1 Tax=Nocardia amamiensis TaxID=404578 RepID=A0ABS0D2J7_9NOCA|nr:aldehyde dehydrogenase family protein [Nocardia amamiensis]
MTAVTEVQPQPKVKEFLSSTGKLLINGEWVAARSGRTFATYDPATGGKLADVAHGEAADIDAAVRAARAAFDGPWSRLKSNQRERLIWRIGDLLSERAEIFGQVESLDNGKSATIAQVVDTEWAGDVFRW